MAILFKRDIREEISKNMFTNETKGLIKDVG